ncbi:tryptophan synthase beta subunit-like PLP-dependent enzyme [Mytilinidion resinicola]|uniref:L-serine ammonia-lyase n=1 Tax=Mytilinidion resinicola TaxID=574789 RepID=A0A6A6YMT0_9PEZI|nr:tryptophan synthase beta subunit-like PLP-dependent enzyme [Mytilinidion resinicola]KAF2809883.1 tryptophan synthase beta subunit-like PLP-dependent enzyme [Mytilinidion resinicola]
MAVPIQPPSPPASGTTSPKEQHAQPWITTPLKESAALSKAAGCRIFLKLENLQPSGSFKSRGIGHYILRALSTLPPGTRPHIFSSSGGNAGLAAVHASTALGLPATVCVPLSTKPLMIAKLHAAGAHAVVSHGAAWAEADAHLRDTIIAAHEAKGGVAIYTPPFDHPDIWAGNSTVVREIAAQMAAAGEGAPDVVMCSVGGGGLLNGVVEGLDALGLSGSVDVLALETAGAESLAASMAAGSLVSLDKITSQATSLGAVRVARKAFEYAMREGSRVRSVVLPDAEAAMGCWRLADDERLMVELACGVNVALCYDGRLEKALRRKVRPDEKVVVVLCGGSNVTAEMLHGWREEYGWVEKGMPKTEAPSEVVKPVV